MKANISAEMERQASMVVLNGLLRLTKQARNDDSFFAPNRISWEIFDERKGQWGKIMPDDISGLVESYIVEGMVERCNLYYGMCDEQRREIIGYRANLSQEEKINAVLNKNKA